MKSLSRTLGIFSIIIFMVGSVLFIPVYDYSTTFWERPSPDKHTYNFSDASSERDSRTLPHTETYLEVSEGVTILDAGESRTLTGIWVHGNGILVLNGCILNIREEDDGHRGEFNVTEDGTLHILNGSKVCIENGNFSARGKEFHMDGSILTVQNLTGGHPGIPGGGGAEIDGKSGHNSTLGIVMSEPVWIMDSEIYCLGQSGGTGGAGLLGEVENGGDGGGGGKAEIFIDAPDVEIDGSTIQASGGKGGTGGERGHNISEAEGGDGGKGGDAFLSICSFENIILRESNINSSGGCGGNASRTDGDELYGEGGTEETAARNSTHGYPSNSRIAAFILLGVTVGPGANDIWMECGGRTIFIWRYSTTQFWDGIHTSVFQKTTSTFLTKNSMERTYSTTSAYSAVSGIARGHTGM